jgi:uncharacterized protein YigE (DUF2233 family)
VGGIVSIEVVTTRLCSKGEMKSVLQPFRTRIRHLALRHRFGLVMTLGFWLLPDLFTVLSATAEPPPCRAATYEGNHYTVCEVDLRRQAVRLFWKKFDGQPYGYLGSLPQSDERSGRLLFATNAGMFHPDYSPVGLYIENGRELVRANAKSGYGNFHMKPNGIFYVGGQGAGILETGAFLRQRPQAEFATQSGPLLVLDGRLHPRFSREGGSRKYRNGVGVRDASAVVFAISEDEVSFGSFARLFRDRLNCANALFLDGGNVPTLYSPMLQRHGNLLPLGPIVGVYDRGN